MSGHATLEVQVGLGDETDPEELAEITARLRRELLELDVADVELVDAGEPPEGAKAVEAIVLGALLVRLAKGAGSLPGVVAAIQGWLGNKAGRTVKLQIDGDTIELTGASERNQKRLVDMWVERHSAPS